MLVKVVFNISQKKILTIQPESFLAITTVKCN